MLTVQGSICALMMMMMTVMMGAEGTQGHQVLVAMQEQKVVMKVVAQKAQ